MPLASAVSSPLLRPGPWTPPALARGGPTAWLAANVAAAFAYFALAIVVSCFFAAYGLFPAPIWLPASIAIVAAMAGGFRLLPGLFVASFLANHVLFAPPVHVSAVVSAGNALGPVLAAALLQRTGLAGRLFTSFAGASAFLLCTTLASPAVSAAGGALALGLGAPFDLERTWSIWLDWWLSDSGGALYLAPALVLWLRLEPGGERRDEDAEDGEPSRRGRERAVWAVAAAASAALFLTPVLHGGALRLGFPFLLVVPLSWIVLRMSLRSAYSLVSLVAIVATAGTVAGVGPFQDEGIGNPLALVGVLVVLLAMNVLAIAALVAERHEAQRARRVKSMFLAKTSHELRQPLNAIIGFSSMIDQQALGPLPNAEYGNYARLIESSGRHLLDLINDLLEMSRIEAGRVELHEERIPLAEAVAEAVAMLELQAQDKGVALASDLDASEIVVRADARALRQVLINLVGNAVKFTPEGGRVEVSAELSGAGDLALRVSDTGVGIPADALGRLFTPFERAARAAIADAEGVGLGLSIARGLVELHGGKIGIESEVGRGTTVTVTLPAERIAAPSARVVRFSEIRAAV